MLSCVHQVPKQRHTPRDSG
jgi:hypothetical protein